MSPSVDLAILLSSVAAVQLLAVCLGGRIGSIPICAMRWNFPEGSAAGSRRRALSSMWPRSLDRKRNRPRREEGAFIAPAQEEAFISPIAFLLHEGFPLAYKGPCV